MQKNHIDSLSNYFKKFRFKCERAEQIIFKSSSNTLKKKQLSLLKSDI